MKIETKTYQKITPATAGNVLTTYKEEEDISKYESYSVMYVPNDFDTSSIREITKEEDESFKEKRDLYIEGQTN